MTRLPAGSAPDNPCATRAPGSDFPIEESHNREVALPMTVGPNGVLCSEREKAVSGVLSWYRSICASLTVSLARSPRGRSIGS